MGAARKLGLPLIVAAALVVIAVVAALSAGQVHSLPSGPARPLPLPTQAAPTQAPPSRAPMTAPPGLVGSTRIFLLVLGIVVGLFVLFLLVLIVRFIIAHRFALRLPARDDVDDFDEAEHSAAEQVRTAVQAGIAELDVDGTDPRSAVIACWVRLEHVAAEAGTPRMPSDTPADFVNRMLAGRRVGAATLSGLAGLYRAARYGPHDVGETMRDDAVRAFTALRAELAHPPAEPARAEPSKAEAGQPEAAQADGDRAGGVGTGDRP